MPMLGTNAQMIPVFEFYFYPEFAIKSGKIKNTTPAKIQILGAQELSSQSQVIDSTPSDRFSREEGKFFIEESDLENFQGNQHRKMALIQRNVVGN